MRSTTKLRQLLKREQILVAPGAHDVLSAKIIQQVGFEAIYFTGYGQSASHLGQPDVGLLTMTEMVSRLNNTTAAVDIPVIADGDTGFGNAINTIRTVREYEKAGAAAIQLEDQVSPKKCGHMLDRQVVPIEEMVSKIRAAVAARRDPDLVIIARTDARTSKGLAEAITRGRAYVEAGADVLFIESPESMEEMKEICSSFEVPILANMVEGGRTPLLTVQELEKLGYKLVIFPTASVYTAAKALIDMMTNLKSSGTTGNFMEQMLPFNEFNELIGLPEVKELETKFAPGACGK